jgi:hypothetical protein
MSRKTGAHFQTARTTRSLLKTLGGDDRKVVRQSAKLVEAERPHAVNLGLDCLEERPRRCAIPQRGGGNGLEVG